MPRAPINTRQGFYETINRNLKLTRPIEWNVVETELGQMVEPRSLGLFDGKIVQQDAVDIAYDSFTPIDGSSFYSVYGTGGPQSFVDFNY
jgi:hypothetical protein